MSVESRSTRVSDCAFRVFTRPLHPEWFSTKQYQRLTRSHWEVDLRLLDRGHVAIWRFGSIFVTEVLSSLEPSLPQFGLIWQTPLRHEEVAEFQPTPGITYQAWIDVEVVDDQELFQHLCEEYRLESRNLALIHDPFPEHRFKVAPFGTLQLDQRSSGVSIQTVHTFPDELTIVRTQSLYEADLRRAIV